MQANYLDAGVKTARALGFKLDGLVDFASLDSAPLLAKPVKSQLAPLIELTKSYCSNSIAQKGLVFEVEQSPDTQGLYYFDEKLMAQVMLGLMDNAVKFTHAGKVGRDWYWCWA